MPRTVDMTDILLVEDSTADAELALRELSRYHFVNRVHHVHGGDEAFSAPAMERPAGMRCSSYCWTCICRK
jgi:hypothetical protein